DTRVLSGVRSARKIASSVSCTSRLPTHEFQAPVMAKKITVASDKITTGINLRRCDLALTSIPCASAGGADAGSTLSAGAGSGVLTVLTDDSSNILFSSFRRFIDPRQSLSRNRPSPSRKRAAPVGVGDWLRRARPVIAAHP